MWPNNNQQQQQQWRGVPPPGVPPPPPMQQQQQQFNPPQQMNIGVVGGQAMGYNNVTNQGQVNPYQVMNQQPPQHQMIQNQMIQNQMIPQPHMQQVQHQQQQQLPPNGPGQMNNYVIPPPSFHPPPPPPPPMNIPPTMNQMHMGPNNAGANQMQMRFPPPPLQPPPNIHPPPPNIPPGGMNMLHQNNNNPMHNMNRNNHYGPSKPDNHYGPSKSIDSNHCGPSKNRNNHYGPSKSDSHYQKARGQPRHENGSERHRKKAPKRIQQEDPLTFFCKVCDVHCNSNKGLEQHLKGERHRRNVEAKTANVLNVSSSSEKHNRQATMQSELENPRPFFCEICSITCQSIESYQQHMNGSGHKKQVEKMKNPNEGFHCQICDVYCSNEYSKQQHMTGKKHKKKAASLGISDDELADSIVPQGPVENVLPIKPPVKPVKEMKPMVSKPLEEKEESDEEGEIDEEKEEIDNLYGEIEKSESTNVQDAEHEEEEEDSDADDMFGDDGDGELEAGHPSMSTNNKSITGQVKDESDEQQEDETDMFGEDDEESQSSETKQQLTMDDTGEIDQETKYEIMEMYGEDDVDESDLECNHNKWSKKLKQIDKAGSQQPVKKKVKQEVKEVKQELGFVLDYTPTTSIDVSNDNTEKQEPSSVLSEGFMLDYSPDTPVKSITNNTEQSNAEQLQQEDDDNDGDMFGSEEEDNKPASGVLTAAEALATARNRSTSNKRAKISDQRHVKIPANISQFDSTHKRSYYPPIHSDKYWSELRSWDFIKDLNEMKKRENNTTKETGTKRPIDNNEKDQESNEDSLPDVFDSVAQYKALWAPLLIDEAKAQLLSDVSSTQTLNGLAVKVELSNHQSSSGEGYNSSDQTVVLRISASTSGDGAECPPINTNDIVLFVHQPSTIDQAFQGKAFEALDDDDLPFLKGRLGLIGHAVNQRARGSVNGLLVRVIKNIWTPFSTLNEIFLFRFGSNVTGKTDISIYSD